MSDDGCEGAEEEPWNNLAMSALFSAGFVGADVDDDAAEEMDGDVTFEDVEVVDEAGRAGSFEDTAVETEAEGLPLTCVDGVAGTDPKDFTLSALTTGVAAGEEDKGEEWSSMEPKVTTAAGMKGEDKNEKRMGYTWRDTLSDRAHVTPRDTDAAVFYWHALA